MDTQIKVVLKAIEGPEKGKVFEFTEQENFLVGRDAAQSQAHFRLSPEDKFISRNHFLLEINPPDCYLRDAGSLNGSFVIRKTGDKKVFYLRGRREREWTAVAQELVSAFQCGTCQDGGSRIILEDGDLIRVGETLIEVNVVREILQDPEPATPKGQNELRRCIGCGKRLDKDVLLKDPKYLTSLDFLCEQCLLEKQANRPALQGTISCWNCGKDLTSLANSDGRAGELEDIALYLCHDCALSKKEAVPISKIGDYILLGELGSGGFGIVYLAHHTPTGRLAGLKITKEKIKRNHRLLQRFKREIAIMREMEHPNLVKLYEDGTTENENAYFASEYFPEKSVRDLLDSEYNGKMPYKKACAILCQALEGLSDFNEKGFVHRDLKPENILIKKTDDRDFVVKVGDFGLSRSYMFHGGTITREGEWAGTVFFCSPEQILHFKDADPRCDVYSMGISLYLLITGEFPYDFPTRKRFFEMLSRGEKLRDPIDIILGKDKPAPIENKVKRLPKTLAGAINRAIDKDPSRRFATAREFKEAIESYSA